MDTSSRKITDFRRRQAISSTGRVHYDGDGANNLLTAEEVNISHFSAKNFCRTQVINTNT